jgi:hypothetical protein
MKIRYIARKNSRIKKGTTKVKEYGRRIYNFWSVICFDENGNTYWWSHNKKRWFKDLENEEDVKLGFSTWIDGIRSVKAFVRFAKKHSKYLPKGTRMILRSNFVGHDIICTL